MGTILGYLTLIGMKPSAAIAGMLGGGMSAVLLPGPLAALGALWKRLLLGALFGFTLAGYAGESIALSLERPNYLLGVSIGLGLFGLSFCFKLLKAWEQFDLGAKVSQLWDRVIDRIFK